MKRFVILSALLALGLLIGAASAQQPGSLVVQGQVIAAEGCLTMLNDAQVLKKQGVCSFAIVGEGIKLPDLQCAATLSGNQGSSVLDTIVDCTYTPIRKLVANPDTPPSRAGTVFLPPQQLALGPDGCVSALNNAGNAIVLGKCGFNVVLLSVAVADLSCTTKVGGGNTTVTCTYPPLLAAAGADALRAKANGQ